MHLLRWKLLNAFIVPRLTDKDMVTVTNAIWKIRAKFYNLGMNLGIDTGTLDCASRKGDDGDALNSVIKTWLQRSEPKPTWSALVQALRGDNVKAGALADEIASKYCPDELKYEEEGTYDHCHITNLRVNFETS